MPESSPRMRGKVKVTAFEWSEIGITPAHAGKRSRASFRKSTARDHPRACGEKSLALPPTTSVLGSPPRTRGKVEIRKKTNQVVGITPAHAGKRFVSVSRNSAVRDHPRACGEKGPLADMKESLPGSPPRLRGKVTIPVNALFRSWPPELLGITPAHAGKSSITVGRQWIHRGGSPPCMRGKASDLTAQADILRITPAHAGKRHHFSMSKASA